MICERTLRVTPLKPSICCLVLSIVVAAALLTAPFASAKSPIKVGVADQSPLMFSQPAYRALHLKRTRYFVPSNVMTTPAELVKATNFVNAARSAGVSTLIHISTSDLRAKRGPILSPATYKGRVGKIVAYFRKLGVTDFGAWNEVNHKSQETWNKPGNAAAYFKAMWTAVHSRCATCSIVGLDVLDQAGVANYIASFYKRLTPIWRTRLKVVGIHNYVDVNRSRTSGTSTIIKAVRKYNKHTRFWFTETGALASFGGSFHYSESRQASRMKNMFSLASKFRPQGVDRVYSYNWFGAENGTACGAHCLFDAGLVDPGGALRPVYSVFKAKLVNYSR
jgi:hypothetical protein